MKTLTLDELKEQVFEQTKGDVRRVVLVCPMCKTPQGVKEFLDAGLSDMETNASLGSECYGRFTKAGSPRKKPDGKPCDWALFGLFQMHDLEIVTPSGETYPYFDLATDAQYAAYHAGLEGG